MKDGASILEIIKAVSPAASLVLERFKVEKKQDLTPIILSMVYNEFIETRQEFKTAAEDMRKQTIEIQSKLNLLVDRTADMRKGGK